MSSNPRADSVVVFDFETTGLSPDQGDRAIEIGAVRLREGRITERFQSLMNPGRSVSPFIEQFTGISNAMLQVAPANETVISSFADFIGDDCLLAHNASFDERFLRAELRRIERNFTYPITCSLLSARRIYPQNGNHKLGTLARDLRLPNDGTFHRALADAEITAHLWLRMLAELERRYGLADITFTLMQRLNRTPRAKVNALLNKYAQQSSASAY